MSDELAAAVSALLCQAPETWGEVPQDLSQVQQQALELLTAAGFIERRIAFAARLPGQEQSHRVIIELTGEYGLVEAMEAAVQNWWTRWRQQWENLKRETGEPVRPVITREYDCWRSTAEGKLAQTDLAAGSGMPIDFALRRGFFDGRPRLLPDGRITRREPVRGYGRLASIENVATGPLAVSVANAPELAEAFVAAFEKILKPATGGLRLPEHPQSKNAAQSQADSELEFVFRQQGTNWYIKAFGEQGHFSQSAGFERLARLVRAGGRPVAMTNLIAGRGVKKPTAAADAAAAELTPNNSTSAPLVDEEAIRKIGEKVKKLNDAIKEAEHEGDVTLAEVYRKELGDLVGYLKAATQPSGKTRKFRTEIDRLRPAIHQSINRACQQLRNAGMTTTANHFEVSIRSEGDSFIYSPSPPIPWQ